MFSFDIIKLELSTHFKISLTQIQDFEIVLRENVCCVRQNVVRFNRTLTWNSRNRTTQFIAICTFQVYIMKMNGLDIDTLNLFCRRVCGFDVRDYIPSFSTVKLLSCPTSAGMVPIRQLFIVACVVTKQKCFIEFRIHNYCGNFRKSSGERNRRLVDGGY